MSRKAVICLSGGLDSATCLALAKSCVEEIFCVGFCYGSKHNTFENQAAQKLCEYYSVPYELIDLQNSFRLFESSLLLSGGEIPQQEYDEENMNSTVVPCRNVVFASILAGIAVSKGYNEIWLGVHGGDHFLYPDCRPDTIRSLQKTLQLASDGKLKSIQTPFLDCNKSDIVSIGHELGVPFELTRTCYSNNEKACGKCGSCRERIESFRKNGLKDPVEYQEEKNNE